MSDKKDIDVKIEYLKQIKDKELFLYEPLMNFNNINIKEGEDIKNYTSQIYNIIQRIKKDNRIIYICDDKSSKLMYLKACIEVIKFYYRHNTYHEIFCFDLNIGGEALLKSTIRKLDQFNHLNSEDDDKEKEIEENIQEHKNCLILIYNCKWKDLLGINFFSLLNNNSSYIIICEKENCIYDNNIYDISQIVTKKKKEILDTPLNISDDLVNLNNKYTFLEERNKDKLIYSYTIINNISKIKYIFDFIQKENEYFPENEIKALKSLSEINNPYILKFIEYGRGNILLNKKLYKNRPYIIFENAQKYSLYDYLLLKPFPEIYSKLIFKKILEGVKAIHDINLCHRNIQVDNILFDENYNPKIYGFNFCCENRKDLQEIIEDLPFKVNNFYGKKKYDGQKLDIICLKHLLSSLISTSWLKPLNDDDKLYRLRLANNPKENIDDNYKLSENFKNLLFKLDKRPTISEILNDDWLKEVNNLSREEIEDLEKEVRDEFEKRKLVIKKYDD